MQNITRRFSWLILGLIALVGILGRSPSGHAATPNPATNAACPPPAHSATRPYRGYLIIGVPFAIVVDWSPGTTARSVPYFKASVFNTIPGAYEEPSCAIASHSDRRGPRR